MIYSIRATVKGCGTLRWDRTTSTRLPFVPLDHPNLTFALRHEARRDCQIISSGNLWRETEEAGNTSDALLPPYTPLVFTEAGITSSEPLLPGDHVPLRLVVTVPVNIAKELDLRIGNICLALRDTTVSLAHGRCETVLSYIKMIDTKTNLRITPNSRDNTFEVDPKWWKDCIIPQVTRKSSSRVVGQDYWLQVLGEFHSETTLLSTVSTSNSDDLISSHLTHALLLPQFVTLLIPVVIGAGNDPPTYDTIA